MSEYKRYYVTFMKIMTIDYDDGLHLGNNIAMETISLTLPVELEKSSDLLTTAVQYTLETILELRENQQLLRMKEIHSDDGFNFKYLQ